MLTDSEKARIRLYLGRPDQFRQPDTRLESIMTSLSEEAEEQIRTCLTALAAVEAGALDVAMALAMTAGVTAAGVERVDEIWFAPNGATGITSLKAAGKFFASRLSIITGVPIAANAFGTAGYERD